MVRLSDVFGISANTDSASYVDRGGLDERFARALRADRHVAVHGGSKQGKSWLRAKVLPDSDSILVQCTPSSTAASLLQEALGRLGVSAVLSMTKSRDLSGTLDFKGASELGKIVAKLRVEAKVGGSIKAAETTELQPIGQTPADLLWVSQTIVAAGRHLVLEDFHYLTEDVQRELAFLFKAMGEYRLFPIIIGIWPQDHLLTYFNGDLDGRMEDIRLEWSDEELMQVLNQGAAALKWGFDGGTAGRLVRDSYGSVGLLQRLAELYCLALGVVETVGHDWGRRPPVPTRGVMEPRPRIPGGGSRPRTPTGTTYYDARKAVATQMQGRYQTFADNFVRGMRRLPEGLEVYRHLLQAATEAADDELIDGIDSAELHQRVLKHEGGEAIRLSDLTQALERVDRLQVKINVNPIVLTYNRSSRKLFLADRSFLFYRQYGGSKWPWSPGEPAIRNDLSISEPLDIDFDFSSPA
jgi:hypothetical protein